jgi:hypothetical protein
MRIGTPGCVLQNLRSRLDARVVSGWVSGLQDSPRENFMRSLVLLFPILTIAGLAIAGELAFLIAADSASITVECRAADGVYIGYQLDDLPSCHSIECTKIEARLDGGEWIAYAAHNGSHLGFIRSKRSSNKKIGEVAEVLLEGLAKSSKLEILNSGTGVGDRHTLFYLCPRLAGYTTTQPSQRYRFTPTHRSHVRESCPSHRCRIQTGRTDSCPCPFRSGRRC